MSAVSVNENRLGERVKTKLVVCLFVIFTVALYAEAFFISGDENVKVSPYLSYFEDVSNSLQSPPVDYIEWKEVGKDAFNAGYTKSTFWFRFEVVNPKTNDYDCVLEFKNVLGEVCLYSPNGDSYSVSKAGFNIPIDSVDISHQFPLFRLNIEALSQKTYYFSVESDGSLNVNVDLSSIGAFYRDDRTKQFLYGIFFGIVIVMSIYHLIVFIFLKDSAYLYYVAAIASYGLYLFHVNGYVYEYLLGNHPASFTNMAPFLGGVSMFFGVFFAQKVLGTKEKTPILHKILSFTVILPALMIATSLFVPYHYCAILGNTTAVIWSVLLIYTAAYISLRKDINAILFMCAHSINFLGVLLFSLRQLGGPSVALIADNANKVGFALDAVLLAIVLSYRFFLMRRETEKTQEAVVTELKEINEMKEKFVKELEEKVNERTRQLEEARNEAEQSNTRKTTFLENMSHELRTPLNSINGIADLLRFGSYEKTDQLAEHLQSLASLLESSEKSEQIEYADKMKKLINFMYEDGNIKRFILGDIEENIKQFGYTGEESKKRLYEVESLIYSEEKETLDAYKYIKDAGDYLLSLINTILDMASVHDSQTIFKKSSVDVRMLVESVMLEAWGYMRAYKKIDILSLSYDIEESVPKSILMDRRRTMQVLQNFLSNAIKFSDKGEVKLFISLDENEGYVRFAVSDEGVGIKDEDKPQIFTEFGKSAEGIKTGVGLSLALSKTLIEAQEGEVGFKSEYGKGCVFWFTLPI